MSDAGSSVPLFVLGAPRSGNTMLGNWLGTHCDVHYLGEFAAMLLAYSIVPAWAANLPEESLHVQGFVRDVQELARTYPARLIAGSGARFWCDSAPWNAAIARTLAELWPDALFVFAVRNFRGMIQSRARYHEHRGWSSSLRDHASTWSGLNTQVATELPEERTVVACYDELCQFPAAALDRLKDGLGVHGLDPEGFDDRALATSWATAPEDARTTAAAIDEQGALHFDRLERFDPVTWTQAMEDEAHPIVLGAITALMKRWPWLEPYVG